MTRELSLSQLTTELTDFLGLPADLDLPPVRKVACERTDHDAEWSVEATLEHPFDSESAWNAISAWAAYTGGSIELGNPYPSSAKCWPSETQRTASMSVVVAGVAIRLKAYVDGEFVAPQPEAAVTR